ncbi:MAG TPA: tetratricopeptide repeat protein [Pyrinomonadaceae bacterium]|jgi:predicted ATPase
MGWTPELTRIRDILARLYPHKEELPRLVEDAGMALELVELDGTASAAWHDIIKKAVAGGRLDALVGECVKSAADAELRGAYQDYLAAARRPGAAPAAALHAPPPLQPPTLIGRDAEVQTLKELLREPETRLLTLTGPSGVGKTALAKRLAVDLAKEFADGVTFVELGALRNHEAAPGEVAGVMWDYKQTVDIPLISFLQDKRRLIVLDGFEAVIKATPFVKTLLGNCPGVKIIITSQQPLACEDEELSLLEKRYIVTPLSYPGAGGQSPEVTAAESAAVKLFVAHAEAIKGKGKLDLGPANMEAIVAICSEVNGLPLCIQILASFISIFNDPPALLEFLRREGFAQLDEEQHLSKAIDIRHASLKPDDQILFRRLAVFADWCSLQAIREVCASAGGKTVPVVTTLRRLVDGSFVQSEGGRYRMLQVIRESAREHLKSSGEADDLRMRFVEHYLAVAREAEPKLKTPERAAQLQELQRDYGNFRAVFDWSATPKGSPEAGLSLAGSLFWYWNFMGYLREGQRRVQKAVRLAAPQAPSAPLAKALYCDGGLTFLLGDYREAQRQLDKSAEAWNAVGDEAGLAYALIVLGMVRKEIGEDLDSAREHEEKSVRLLAGRDEWGHALALNDLGNVLAAQGLHGEARRSYEESKAMWGRLKDTWGLSLTLSNLSSLECKEQNYGVAYDLMRDALKLQLEAGDKWGRAWSLKGIGEAKLGMKDYAAAASHFYESYRLHSDLGRKQLIAECLEGLAKVAAGLGQESRAASLHGAAESLREQSGSSMSSAKDREYDGLVNRLRLDMGMKAFERARAEGRAWTEERLQQQVQSYALDLQGGAGP